MVDFGHGFNFLETVQKKRLNALESFSTTPNVILGLFEPFSRSWKNSKNWAKSKGKPLTILVNFGHFFNFLKTHQKQRLNTLELFSTTPNVVLGVFEAFLKSWKNSENRTKSKGWPLTILVDFGHLFNFLKTVQKQTVHALETFSTTPNVFLGLFEPFPKSWKNGKNWAKSKG